MFSKTSIPAPGLTQPAAQSGRGVQLTAHLHPVPRLRISGDEPPLTVYLFMAWTMKILSFTIKIQHTVLYIYIYIYIYIYKHIFHQSLACFKYRIIFKGTSHKYANCHRLHVMHVWKPTRIFVAILNQYVNFKDRIVRVKTQLSYVVIFI